MGKRLFLKSALVSRLGSLKGCSWGEAPAWLKLTSKLGKFRHLLVTWPAQAIIQHCSVCNFVQARRNRELFWVKGLAFARLKRGVQTILADPPLAWADPWNPTPSKVTCSFRFLSVWGVGCPVVEGVGVRGFRAENVIWR